MIVPQKTDRYQQKLLPRQERRPELVELDKKKRKLLVKLKDVNLNVEFTNKTTTSFGNFALIETFKNLKLLIHCPALKLWGITVSALKSETNENLPNLLVLV